MRLKELLNEIENDDELKYIDKGLGAFWHLIQVLASYGDDYGRWMTIDDLKKRYLISNKDVDDEETYQNLRALDRRGVIEFDEQTGQFRVDPEIAEEENKERRMMSNYIDRYERTGGRSFTYGT